MGNIYKEFQKRKNTELIRKGFFNGDKGKKYPYILSKCENNFYPSISCSVMDYFSKNKINWQNSNSSIKAPSVNTLKSQIACLNHLFYIKRNRFLCMHVLNFIINRNFIDVLPFEDDINDNGYIAFEFSNYT